MTETELDNQQKSFSAWVLAWELGYQIAIPLVAFAFLGRFLDKKLETSPWLLVLGVLFAATFSSYLVYRKVAKLLK